METQELTLHNELKRKSIFLRDYTTELYASGATTIRIEKNLGRIAEQSLYFGGAEIARIDAHDDVAGGAVGADFVDACARPIDVDAEFGKSE